MGLVGSLEDLSLLDILQIVNVSRRTGVLRIRRDGTPDFYIHFRSGCVEDIVGGFDEGPFFHYFLQEGLVEEREFREAEAKAGGSPRRALHFLVAAEILNDRLVEQARRRELSGRLRLMVRDFKAGEFAFFLAEQNEEAQSGSPGNALPLKEPVSPQNLLSQSIADQAIRDSAPQPRIAAPPSPAAAPQPPVPTAAALEEEHLPEAEAVPVESHEPVGELPVVRPATPPRPEPAPPSVDRLQPGKNALTVVLAADESVFKNLLWQRLLKHFSRVERVGSLGDYLSLTKMLLERRTPFVTLVDLLMPTQDGKGYLGGLEILEQSQARFPEVKVLLTTDLLDPRMDDLARSKGAVAVIRKPELARLQVGQLESAIDLFGETLCAAVDRLVPPIEEEVASFLRDLGAETVSEGFRVRDQLSLLKGLMGELANPQESAEISLLVLRLASEYFERAVLFLVKRDELVGLGGFGDTGDHENMIQKVRRLRVPVGVGSSVDDALSTRASVVRSQADARDVDRDFHDAIGAYTPRAFAFLPMVSRGRAIAVLYADNAVTNAPIPDISGMEIFMAQAGLAMEKALLERQLMSIKKGLGRG